ISEATSSGTGSLPASQSRTSLGHTPSFWASRPCPQAMRRNSRLSCAGVNSAHPVSPLGRHPRGLRLKEELHQLPLSELSEGWVGLETDRSYEQPHRPVGSSCLRRSCGRSSSTPRSPQPSVFPQPPLPGSSAPADRCRGYSCPRPLSDPTD